MKQYRNEKQLLAAAGRCQICNAIRENNDELCNACFAFLSKYGSSVDNIEALSYYYRLEVLAKQAGRLESYVRETFDYGYCLED